MIIVNHGLRIWCSLVLLATTVVYTALVYNVPGVLTPFTVIYACLAVILILIDLRARRKPNKPR